jgi:hypothetical protein
MSNPYLFIVGCPRSGTTLLQRMVDAHPQIAIMSESRWIAEWFEERKGLTPDGTITSELLSQLLENPRFVRLHIGRERLMTLIPDGSPVSYSSFVTGIFDLYGERKGKPLVGNKTPAYVRKLDVLHTLWPKVRFVHLIRDGRDVCLSVANWPKACQADKPGSFTTWRDGPVSTTALWWDLNVRRGRQAAGSLEPRLYYEIRYESLVSHPREECASLCAFLGLRYDDAMLRFHEGRTRSDPGLSAKRARRPVTPGLRDWRSQMPAQDVERFEAAAGELLVELGYSRAFPSPRHESLEGAAKARGLLGRDPAWIGLCAGRRVLVADENPTV